MEGMTAAQRPTTQQMPLCAAKLVPHAAHSSAAQPAAGTAAQSTWGITQEEAFRSMSSRQTYIVSVPSSDLWFPLHMSKKILPDIANT